MGWRKKRDGTSIKMQILHHLAIHAQAAVYSSGCSGLPLESLLCTNPTTLKESLHELVQCGLVMELTQELTCGPVKVVRLTAEGERLVATSTSLQLLNKLIQAQGT
jgi:DNA-binding MarR family transcriptional regulator